MGMARRTYSVPYAKGEITFGLPEGFKEAVVVEHRSMPPLEHCQASIRLALQNPTGCPPLRELASPGDKVCIVVTDMTRPCPDHLLVPPLLKELGAAGVDDGDVIFLIGVGMHRESTAEEKVAKLGAEVARRYAVLDSDPLDGQELVDLGITTNGVPAVVNKKACQADLLIATGVVEPHLYAGYSGGRKTVAIGAAGERTIEVTHGPQMLDHPSTRLGRIGGNPFHQAVTEIAKRAGLRFILNVVLDDGGEVVALEAGEPEAAFEGLVDVARSFYEAEIPRQFEVVIGGVGYPKDINLYQTSRAPTYLFFAPQPVIKRGGTMIIPARCQEGVGQGLGEQRFYEIMKFASDATEVLQDARRHGYPAGGQRAFVMAKVLQECEVIIVGTEHPQLVREIKMIPAADMGEALRLVEKRHGREADILIVPHALHTLPVVKT
jgi:nickel-dependent lactate racemase